MIFETLQIHAKRDGVSLLADGTNASDDEGDRPGIRALRELAVRSPLRECGLTKAEIRRLSREAGLPTWDKPAYSCLATRIPHGTRLDADTLKKVERAEAALMEMGFSDFRVRVAGDAAKIQLRGEQMERLVKLRSQAVSALKKYFRHVLLDLEERS